MNILIAEDHRMTLRMLEKYLEELDYEVTAVEDGKKAWEEYQDKHPQIIITDWEMPEMNGLELIKNIRNHEDESYTYIILLTAKDEKSELVEGLSAGADDYIRKPFDRDELRVRVRAGKRIVDLQGGRIWFHAGPGEKGTVFKFIWNKQTNDQSLQAEEYRDEQNEPREHIAG